MNNLIENISELMESTFTDISKFETFVSRASEIDLIYFMDVLSENDTNGKSHIGSNNIKKLSSAAKSRLHYANISRFKKCTDEIVRIMKKGNYELM